MHILSHISCILVNTSDVLWRAVEREDFWTVWTFLSFSVVHCSDVSRQLIWMKVFGAQGALHFNVVMNISNMFLRRRSLEHLRTERAMFSHIIMNFSDMILQIPGMEVPSTERAMFAHIITIINFFDVSCQVAQWYQLATSRAHFLDARMDLLHVSRKPGRCYLFLALWARGE